MSYRGEKFNGAVNILVSGSDRIQERLFNAVAYNNFIALDREFPEEELYKEFKDLMDELTKEEPIGNEGSWKATIEKMSEEKASELAIKIVEIYDEICRRDL